MRATLLTEAEQQEPACVPVAAECGVPADDGEPPYSPANEVRCFFVQGIPLMVAALLEWGVPPLINMAIAGHTPGSATLQASVGFARVFYHATVLMQCNACSQYLSAVVPGCIGAGRTDRIPRYFQRALVLSYACIVPFLALQLFSESIMRALGVPGDVATQVGTYTRLMIATAVLFLLECQLETLFITFGYTKCDAAVSLVTGLGVDVGGFYYAVYVRGWGMWGVAAKEVAVKAARVLMWLGFATYFGLWRTLLVPSRAARAQPLLSRRELGIFIGQTVPKLGTSFSGWLVFELQLLVLSNIRGIGSAGLAAGAIWVQARATPRAMQARPTARHASPSAAMRRRPPRRL